MSGGTILGLKYVLSGVYIKRTARCILQINFITNSIQIKIVLKYLLEKQFL